MNFFQILMLNEIDLRKTRLELEEGDIKVMNNSDVENKWTKRKVFRSFLPPRLFDSYLTSYRLFIKAPVRSKLYVSYITGES